MKVFNSQSQRHSVASLVVFLLLVFISFHGHVQATAALDMDSNLQDKDDQPSNNSAINKAASASSSSLRGNVDTAGLTDKKDDTMQKKQNEAKTIPTNKHDLDERQPPPPILEQEQHWAPPLAEGLQSTHSKTENIQTTTTTTTTRRHLSSWTSPSTPSGVSRVRVSTGVTLRTAQQGGLGSLAMDINQANKESIVSMVANTLLPQQVAQQWGGTGNEQFVGKDATFDPQGQVHVRSQQTLLNMPVEGASIMMHANKKGEIYAMNGEFVDEPSWLSNELYQAVIHPLNQKRQAPMQLRQALVESGLPQQDNDSWLGDPKLAVVRKERDGSACLAWKQDYQYTITEEGPSRGRHIDTIFANAAAPFLTGIKFKETLCAIHPRIHGSGTPTLRTYDCQNLAPFPVDCTANLISDSSTYINTPDVVANNAHNFTIETYRYYWETFNRDSIDDAGLPLISNVHFGNGVDNAFWDGSQMTYGDGLVLFDPLCNDADVVGHELTHGVTERTSNLVYRWESGAINEAMSDVFGAAVDRFTGATGSDVWYIGEDIALTQVALRNMADPEELGDIDFYPERLTVPASDGYTWVHVNSGIQNLAFYLLSEGGTHPRGKSTNTVTGIGFDAAAQIFYFANTACLTSGSTFAMARFCTVLNAAVSGTDHSAAVTAAWDAVAVPSAEDPRVILSLQNGVGLSGQQVTLQTSIYYQLDTQLNAGDTVTCMTECDNGDADLYVGFSDLPRNGGSLECVSLTASSNELCGTGPASSDGTTVFVEIYGYDIFSDLTITCTINAPPIPAPAPAPSPAPMVEPLFDGIVVSDLTASTGELLQFEFQTPLENTDAMVCYTGGANGDADLAVFFGGTSDNSGALQCLSTAGNSDETCWVTATSDETAFVEVFAFFGFQFLNLVCFFTPLNFINVAAGPTTGISGTPGQLFHFRVIPALSVGQQATCTISGDNGDADLFMKAGPIVDPFFDPFDCASNDIGSNEACTVTATTTDVQVFGIISAFSEFTDLTLTCTINDGPAPAPAPFPMPNPVPAPAPAPFPMPNPVPAPAPVQAPAPVPSPSNCPWFSAISRTTRNTFHNVLGRFGLEDGDEDVEIP